ncbi:MAG: putative 2-aminoethylphosphonate ABC transporter permease subunit [Dongiaceae bacterium]
MAIASVTATVARPLRQRADADAWIMRGALVAIGLYLIVTVVLPLYSLLAKSFENRDGDFIGLGNYVAYFANPALFSALIHSIVIGLTTTAITVPLAFIYAYAVTRSRMPGRALFRGIALLPLLAPSLLPALSLLYLFGNQGMLKGLLLGHSVYGPIGIVIGEVFFTFPQALMILLTALANTDQRLYDAAISLRAAPSRIFRTVTLSSCRYGLISAGFVTFTLAFTDFGVPKVIGGDYNVLATDVYQQVVGQFNFQMGAVVGMILLAPAVLSFVADRMMQRRQVALVSARAVPFTPAPDLRRDVLCLAICGLVAVFILGMIGMAAFGSIITYWPYDLTITFKNYDFGAIATNGWEPYRNSLVLASATAVFGTAIIFSGAYLVEKSRGFRRVRGFVQFLCLLPLAVPGLVIGLAYIFFFNEPSNPLHFLYLTMAILVINTIAHFYTVCHLTAVTALKQLDPEFEAVSASLGVPAYKTLWRVAIPICLPAIVDIGIYLFVNAMTTVSAVVFLYSADTKLASIAVLNMDDAGKTSSAAAMGMTIVASCILLRLLQVLLMRGLSRRSEVWRQR